MNVLLNETISVIVNTAKLVVESDGRSTIEFTILDQPVRLNIDSTDYTYDIDIVVGDRVSLKEDYGVLSANSSGIVKEIIPDRTQDKVKVYFDEVLPNRTFENVEANADTTTVSIIIELPLSEVEKVE